MSQGKRLVTEALDQFNVKGTSGWDDEIIPFKMQSCDIGRLTNPGNEKKVGSSESVLRVSSPIVERRP